MGIVIDTAKDNKITRDAKLFDRITFSGVNTKIEPEIIMAAVFTRM